MSIKLLELRVVLKVRIPVRDDSDEVADDVEDQVKDWYSDPDHKPLTNVATVLSVETEQTGHFEPDPT